MEKYFWYKTCPVCDGQGRLFIMEDISRKRLYLHCEECELGFPDPSQLESNFLTLGEDYKYKFADFQTIKKYGWESIAQISVTENQVPNI